jgi:tripartite-type tricarboxylate transporter receptor subunit TctC
MQTRFLRMLFVAFSLMLFGVGAASGQDYPTKPIRILASTAGGGTDFAARVLANGLASGFGKPIVVENRAAFSSTETAAKAAPDGYTLLSMGLPVWLTPFLQDNVPWEPLRDFQPITTMTRQVTILVVHSSLPVKSVADLIALAKARPGELNYGSGGTGTSSHLSGELFKSMTGTAIERINYKGSADATNDLLGGRVQMMFGNPASIGAHVKSGRLRALAVSSATPSVLYPGLPPIASAVPGYELVEYLGLFAPAKTPNAIITRWNQAAARLLNSPEWKEKFLSAGSEVFTGSPEAFTAAIKSDMDRFGKVIREARLKE